MDIYCLKILYSKIESIKVLGEFITVMAVAIIKFNRGVYSILSLYVQEELFAQDDDGIPNHEILWRIPFIDLIC